MSHPCPSVQTRRTGNSTLCLSKQHRGGANQLKYRTRRTITGVRCQEQVMSMIKDQTRARANEKSACLAPIAP